MPVSNFVSIEVDLNTFSKRRPLNDDEPDGYLESDNDFVLNNFDLAIVILEQLEELNLKKEINR